jgi:hypothetical protein
MNKEEVKKEIEDDIAIGYTLASAKLFVSLEKFHKFAEELLGEPISNSAMSNNFKNPKLWERLRAKYEKERLNNLNNYDKRRI